MVFQWRIEICTAPAKCNCFFTPETGFYPSGFVIASVFGRA
jgi:hypothetical protein